MRCGGGLLTTKGQVLVTEKGDQGSLFWLLKATHTAFGARLLRHWVRADSPTPRPSFSSCARAL
jgi:DNA mismatch repair ATPase MutS